MNKMTSSSQSKTILLVALSALFGLCASQETTIPVPHVSIYMLCIDSGKDLESMDFGVELENFYGFLITDSTNVQVDVEMDSNKCLAYPKGVQLRLESDGYLDIPTTSNLTKDELQGLVTPAGLETYFEGLCDNIKVWEALVSEANSTTKAFGATTVKYTEKNCASGAIASVAGLGTAAILGIAVSILVLFCCIVSCMCNMCASRKR
jgi:hypothetical protein